MGIVAGKEIIWTIFIIILNKCLLRTDPEKFWLEQLPENEKTCVLFFHLYFLWAWVTYFAILTLDFLALNCILK